MALANKNQMVGQRGVVRNEYCNGGSESSKVYDENGKFTGEYAYTNSCLRKYNAANCGVMWKTKQRKGRKLLSFGIKRKRGVI